MQEREAIEKLIELGRKYRKKKNDKTINKECDSIKEIWEDINIDKNLPDDLAFIRRAEYGELQFFNKYFAEKVEKLEWNGRSDMAMNIIFGSFDCGMRFGYIWRDIVEEPLREFKRRAEEIGEKEFRILAEMAKRWNETGEI